MNREIEAENRFITVIVDPHIKSDTKYPVYADGLDLEKKSTADNLINIFVKNPLGKGNFVGDCWPGASVWIDYLNENAQDYWGSWFAFDKFKGSTSRYHIWNDMNEPSVFDTSSKTMPLDRLHCKANGLCYQHRDVHNSYGGLQWRSSYQGLLKRDEDKLRPFVLTRSWFMGSQRFGAYWTGDNNSQNEELQGSMTMILQNGLGGQLFGGADIPGFIGTPQEDLWVMFYQLGTYYPFMRAHSTIDNQNREPWLQSERV